MADVFQLPRAEFLSTLDEIAPPERADDLPGVSESTRAALLQTADSLQQNIDPFLLSESKRLGARRDVPFNVSEGASVATRTRLGLDHDRMNQLKYLTEKFGPGNVDINEDGQFILRNQLSDFGVKEDILVNPLGVDVGDYGEIGSQAIPMTVGTLGAKFGMGKIGQGPFQKVLGATLGMAAGQEATGFTQDAVVRWLSDNEVNASELAKHRAGMAIADTVLGLGFAGAAKTAAKAAQSVGLLLGKNPPLTATKAAKEKLKSQTKVDYPLTPGEESESTTLLRTEQMVGQRIGFANVMDRVRADQRAAQGELRRVFHGLPRNLTDDELTAALPRSDAVGQQGLQRLRVEAQRLDDDVLNASRTVQEVGTQEAQRLAGVDLMNPIDRTATGAVARSRVVSDMAKFKEDMGARYNDFLSRPEISGRIVNADDLAEAAIRIEDTLTPSAKRIVKKPTGLVDEFDQPITQAAEEVERLNAFVSGKVKGFLDELKGLRGATVSVSSLKQIRTEIDNAIKEGIAIPGTDIKQIVTIKKAVDDSITGALQGMDDKTLLPTWQGLNADFAKGMDRFNREGIRELLVKPGESGSISDPEIADMMAGSGAKALAKLQGFKEFFGAASPEFSALKQAARQKVLRGTADEITDYVGGAELRSRLRALDEDVATELFGLNKSKLHEVGEILAKSKGNIDLRELAELARNGRITANAIGPLMAAEEARATAFNNKLIRAAAKGFIDGETVKPSEFVRYASKMDPDDLSRVLGVMSNEPDLILSIRRLAIEDIWGKAMAGPEFGELISSRLLRQTMGSETQQRTWRQLIGNDAYEGLQSMADMLGSREISKTAKNMGGSIAAANDLAKLFYHGEIGSIPDIGARFLLGMLYTGPMRRPITNLLTSHDRGRILNAVVSSTPFIEGVLEQYGPELGIGIMQSLRQTIEPMNQRQLQVEGKVNGKLTDLSPEEFNEWLKNNIKQ